MRKENKMTKKFNISTRLLTLFVMLAILLTSLPIAVFGKKASENAYDQVEEADQNQTYTDSLGEDVYEIAPNRLT